MDEIKNMGTDLKGGTRSSEQYEGHPRPYSSDLQQERKPVDINPREHDGTHDPERTGHFNHSQSGNSNTTGATGSSGPLHQSTDERHGAGALAAAGAATAAGHHHNQQGDRSLPGQPTLHDSHTTSNETSTSGHGRDATLGSGAAGVAAGSATHDHGRDHTTAENVRDLDRNDTQGKFGDSGATTTGTALGGRSEGNTAANAASAASATTDRDTSKLSPAEQQGSTREASHEPSNLTGGDAEPRKRDIPDNDDVQHASRQGQDPSLEKEKGGKLTGTGQDGSHSAVFGLTPDGHKFNDTKNTAGGSAHMPKAEGESDKPDAVDGDGNTSRAPGSGKVADQIDDPRVAEKGHGGKAEYTDSNAKPGAGTF